MGLLQIESVGNQYAFGPALIDFNPETFEKNRENAELIKRSIGLAITDAMEKLNERKSFFSDTVLIDEAKEQLKERISSDEKLSKIFKLKDIKNEDIKSVINEFIINGKIVKGDNNEKLTSREYYEFEQTILDYNGKTPHPTLFGKKEMNAAIKKWEDSPEEHHRKLSGEQRRALEAMLNNDDNYLIIQGHAGTGKTSVMKAFKDILQELANKNGVPITGLAMTGKASRELENDSGIKSHTIKSFLGNPGILLVGNTIVIDEAGLLPTKKFAEVVKIAKEKECKIVLAGDVKQYGSIEAGGMFKELQNRCKTVEITEIRRQRKNESLLDAVTSMANKNVPETFEKLKKQGNIYTISDADKLKAGVVGDYADKLKRDIVDSFAKDIKADAILKMTDISKKSRDDIFSENIKKSVILVSNDTDKDNINDLVRKKLKEEEILKVNEKNTCTVDCLQNRDLLDFDKKRAKNYELNDIIKSIDEKGEKSYKVVAVDEKNNFIFAENINTKKIEKLSPAANFEVFKETNKDFCVNDNITFLRDYDKAVKGKDGGEYKILEGQTAVIKDISKDKTGGYIIKAEIGEKEKDVVYFHTKNYNAIDYSYAMTSRQSQCISVDNVFVYNNGGETNYNEMYVDMTRAKKNLKIYTTDENKMINDSKKEQVQEAFSSKSHSNTPKANLKTRNDFVIDKKENKANLPETNLKTWKDFVMDKEGNKANADLAYTSYLLNKNASKNSIYRKLVSESDIKERHGNPDKYITGVIEEAKKSGKAQYYKKSVSL
jgi:hypothetical protein